MRPAVISGALVFVASLAGASAARPPAAHLRVNLAGYGPADRKVAVLFAEKPVKGWFTVRWESAPKPVLRARIPAASAGTWGRFPHHYALDVSAMREPGAYVVEAAGASARFTVGPHALREWPGYLLEYLRQQRCGYNPFLDTVCHPFDGRTAYGPLAAGTYVDARGGWHDAGDQLKYLITSSNATGQLLLAWQLRPAAFDDRVDALGRLAPNGDPDVLDEARWGLEWMLRLHPAPDQLYHQVADDRDHIGWKLPQDEQSDYGWGKGGYRVVYAADGRPQGLGKFQSASNGIANLAGRYAAAMALAHQVWKGHPHHRAFAERCLQAGREADELGRQREGFQQGNSYDAPYRYNEDTWADDMEWGAAELFKATGERRYLDEAVRYARLIGATSMMGRDTSEHYQDSFADFQGEAVYHDDLTDYSTNEPTMDGTASAVLLFALLGPA